ncbi:Signal transduction histidine kinase [Amycolatopsis lurida]|uniref:Oxygen sensor histidine kinase NreB n=1 Tax=Amycolatopsis lurida NRRL 2430 TaxID=1460371 RepID=A0A2P2FUG6_AMYLU|nr:sensor histidine kinase [Amycolatopsis lurida]KFU80381.1 histidine kinase [Amycolatopsis lurida NRRL 2430]SEE56228.1 Signal transduction histidine kinase [Amycolatopsis lurida]
MRWHLGPATRLNAAMHTGFFLLLAASVARFVAGHGLSGATPLILVLTGALALVYAAGVLSWELLDRWRPVWLTAVIAVWLALVVAAPSFAWCAVPLFFVCLQMLRPRVMIAVVVLLTAATILAQLRIASGFDPSLVLAPIAVALMATMTFLQLDRDRRQLGEAVKELLGARVDLAQSQRLAGMMQERERLAREIHDALAQGLSSMRMLLQAAQRSWDTDPELAKSHVSRAVEAAGDNLAEARRFVKGLGSPRLDAGDLVETLKDLAEQVMFAAMHAVRFETSGDPYPLSPEVEAGLLRVAQGALANVSEHAKATKAAVTLTYLADKVVLDIRDDGVGFDPASTRASGDRGNGLRMISERLAELGGEMVVESAPGEGTALAVAVPTREVR